MNLFFKSYKFYLIFFLVIASKAIAGLGQSKIESFVWSPVSVSFEIPSIYNRYSNTSLVIDQNGIIYVGKENGIYLRNGANHHFIQTNAPCYLSLANNGEVIYLTVSDFGRIIFDEYHSPSLRSESNKIESHFIDFFPYNATTFDEKVFLATSEGVFIVLDTAIQDHFLDRKSGKLFNSGTQLFLSMGDEGLSRWNGNKFVPVISDMISDGSEIISIFNVKEHIFIQTENDLFEYSIEDNRISYTDNELIKTIRNLMVFPFQNGQLLCQSRSFEIAIMADPNVDMSRNSFMRNTPRERLRGVFIDSYGDKWFYYDFDIIKIRYPSIAKELELGESIGAAILSSVFSETGIYLGTSEGLFKLSAIDSIHWTLNKYSLDPAEYFNALSESNGIIAASGNKGLYVIEGDSIKNLMQGNCSYSIIKDQMIVALESSGLYKYIKKGNSWQSITTDHQTQIIHSWTEFDDAIWILNENNTIVRISLEETSRHTIQGPLELEEAKLFEYYGQLMLSDGKQNYNWSITNSRFERNELINPSLFRDADHFYSAQESLWGIQSTSGKEVKIWKLGTDKTQIPYYEISSSVMFGEVTGIGQINDHLWFSGKKKIVKLNPEVVKEEVSGKLGILSALKRSTRNHNAPQILNQSEKLPYGGFTIEFELAENRYNGDEFPYYRYKLTHYQEDWSDWTSDPVIEFKDLRERNYIFQAQSVSPMGILSEIEEFQFTVKAPFHRKWFVYIFYFILLAFISFLLYKWRLLNLKKVEYRLEEVISQRMASVLSEKEKSDKLVADLFPKGTAEEIKSSGRAKSKKFEMVTVLFSDIQGFTKIAEEMNPEVLIDELDKFFFHFDSVVEKYNIEKIKTIGDAYMAAGGIPVKNSSNPVEVVLAGIEMQYYMNDLKKKKADIWDLRIGIHTGPIISGVVGHKKLSYDIWGDTVNTASRMESSGEGGRVNISGMTYSLVKDFFICEYRGKLPVKYKGNIDMFFVNGLRPELSVDLKGIPNKRFFTKLQLVRLHDVEERVMDSLVKNQEVEFHFHKPAILKRTRTQTELLGRSVNLTEEDMLIAQTAAILLYAGLAETYENYEIRSAEIARTILPEYAYDEKQIDRVSNLILSAREPFKPVDRIEEILIDAKMEFIGRSDYVTLIKLLFLEEKNFMPEMSKEKFIKKHSGRLKNFQFNTLAAQRLREVDSESQIQHLKNWK